MKLTLEVMSPGKGQGKQIPITLSQFVIGRDPECQLRPASAAVSKRHCAVIVRGETAFVRDFESTNGTFVNDEQVKGEKELKDADLLKVGPLLFTVRMQAAPAPAVKATAPPAPAAKASGDNLDDESAAAMLLALQDDDSGGAGGEVDSQGVPTGSTVMEMMAPPAGDSKAAKKEEEKPGAKKSEQGKPASAASTSVAAKAILEKYMRRPRT